jgi:hypothetical protein
MEAVARLGRLGTKLSVKLPRVMVAWGMLLGYHPLWFTTANVVGTYEQKDRIQRLIIENNYFVGGQ